MEELGEEIPVAVETAQAVPQPLDCFRAPLKPSQADTLETGFQDMVRRLEESFSMAFGCGVTAAPFEVFSTSSNSIRSAVPANSIGIIFRDGVSGNRGGMVVAPMMIAGLLESLLGANPAKAQQLFRPLTDVERQLLSGAFSQVLSQCASTIPGFESGRAQIVDITTIAKFFQEFSAVEELICFDGRFTIQGLLPEALLTLISPDALHAAANDSVALHEISKEAISASQEAFGRRIQNAQLTFEVRLSGATISVDDLMRLKEGDSLVLDLPIVQPFEGLLNEQLRFSGQMVADGKKRAFAVVGLS